MMVHRTPFFLPWLYPGLTWRMPSTSPELYLTFDDGPVPGVTEFVLETLSKYDVRATFFCIGDNILKHPDIFMRLVREGHTVGNHTFNHLNGWRTPVQEYLENVKRCEQEMTKRAGIESLPRLFRPPYGRITRSQINALSDWQIIMWDVLTVDYDRKLSENKCLANSLAACRNGSIIVFHDSYKAEKNVTFVLPRLIEHFLEKGVSFKPIT